MATTETTGDIHMAFVSAGLPNEQIQLRGVHGKEELSQLFCFRLILSRPKPFTDDELDVLLNSHCGIAMGLNPSDTVHGILSDIQLLDHTRTVDARYLATMVPTMSLLQLARSCRVFQDLTTTEIIKSVLELYSLKEGRDFDIRVHTPLPKREYIVQYQETDWSFLSRWMEHEGLFYWFEHGAGGEKLVVADENEDTTPIADPHAISYRERNNLDTSGESTIWNWQLLQKRIPARVAVIDYNYRTPHIPLAVADDVDTKRGFGSVFHYGEHFKNKDEGKRTAKIRAEQLRCTRRVYAARTNCPRFRVGHTFELENHHDAEHDGKYLITSIEHRVGHPVRTGDVEDYHLGDEPERYFAKLTAIPLDTVFRPERRTPWPEIRSVMHAHIAGDGSGEHAEIDGAGRYKVRLPFDTGGPKGSKSSRWIRKAQPYAGGGYGQHFPLHKGTEVLLAHIDGDPDRPIIVGAVPNAHTISPSTGANATQSVIHTASGIRIEMEDNEA